MDMDLELKDNIIIRISKLLQEANNQKDKIDYEIKDMKITISNNFKYRVSVDTNEIIEKSEKKKLALEYYILTLDMIIENDNFDYGFLEERYYLFYRGMAGAVYKNVSIAIANAYYDAMLIVESEKKRLKGS